MKLINKLINEKRPFAITQHFEWFRADKDQTIKVYELHYVNKENILSYRTLSNENMIFVRTLLPELNLVIDNKHGKVYEFMKFREYLKQHGL